MAKNQPHPSDPAKRQIAARPANPAPVAPPSAPDPAALRGQGLAGLAVTAHLQPRLYPGGGGLQGEIE